MKYFVYVRNKQFTQALAALKPNVRYMTAKRRWYAARLGLYRTVLKYSLWLPVKMPRHTLISTIANIKRQNLTDDMAKSHIEYILYNKQYHQFHHELIKETISFYPEVIFDFLKRQSGSLSSTYYQGLYIALRHKYHSSDLSLESYLLRESESDYTDNKCLYNNVTINSDSSSASLSRLTNLNQIFTHHQLNSIKLFDEQQQLTVTNLSAVKELNKKQRSQGYNHLHKVTVIVTTYNASETIESCIYSLLQQTWRNLEIIVVDDASSDNTLLHLQHLCDQNTAIKVISLPKNIDF